MPSDRSLAWRAVPLLALALAGCGRDGSAIVPVTGTLTYKGAPVTNAYLRFRPEHGRPSWAQTDDRGRFVVRYDKDQDGAVVGRHKVWLEPRSGAAGNPQAGTPPDAVMPGSGEGTRPGAGKSLAALFEKYSAEKSKLTVEITPETRDLPLNLD
jgi:hypothetical protein